ncbi:50S ribosomal protein L25 [Sporosalibacterium faouarense]|uniref:50S ribosomal protein L25 n=1 Tax=Sporosalibacterium faouarense TaxID=516123 RepID=UPI00141CFCAE|nr:50S ribosomal protein L25 [Sporosalibacterium faouarense]MTI48800.1 50S ribosomal protein L25 [Bacillota bacterium]
MPDTFLDCSLRNDVGSNASHRVRANGHVPGVIYGHHISSYPLEFDRKEINRIIKDHGENALVNVMVNGSSYPAMIKEIQRDSLTGGIIHLDLQQINISEKIHTAIPIVLNGKEKVDTTGILQKQLEKIEVECYPDKVPRFVSIDISDLVLGNSLRVSDVEFSEDFSILNDGEEVIVSLSHIKDEEVDDVEDTSSSDLITEEDQPELVGQEDEEAQIELKE